MVRPSSHIVQAEINTTMSFSLDDWSKQRASLNEENKNILVDVTVFSQISSVFFFLVKLYQFIHLAILVAKSIFHTWDAPAANTQAHSAALL